jgi:hypothetical protein
VWLRPLTFAFAPSLRRNVTAFVVPTDAAVPSAEELPVFARQSLASFKVPTEWLFASARRAIPRQAVAPQPRSDGR